MGLLFAQKTSKQYSNPIFNFSRMCFEPSSVLRIASVPLPGFRCLNQCSGQNTLSLTYHQRKSQGRRTRSSMYEYLVLSLNPSTRKGFNEIYQPKLELQKLHQLSASMSKYAFDKRGRFSKKESSTSLVMHYVNRYLTAAAVSDNLPRHVGSLTHISSYCVPV